MNTVFSKIRVMFTSNKTRNQNTMSRLQDIAIGHGEMNIPLIGRLPLAMQYKVAGAVLAVSLIATAVGLVIHNRLASEQSSMVASASRLEALSQQIAKDAVRVSQGGSVGALHDGYEAFEKTLDTVAAYTNYSPSAKAIAQKIQTQWHLADKDVERLIERGGSIQRLYEAAGRIEKLVAQQRSISTRLQPLLILGTQKIIFRQKQFSMAVVLADIESNSLRMVSPEGTTEHAQRVKNSAIKLAATARAVASVEMDILPDFDWRELMNDAVETADKFLPAIDPITSEPGLAKKISEARAGATNVYAASVLLAAKSGELRRAIEADRSSIATALAATVVFSVLSLSAMFLIALVNIADVRRRATASASENKRNQEAIIRLLNEMGDLAQGDLTVKASVTEDMTGAIADSMNLAVEGTRSLVQEITTAAHAVDEATTEVRTHAYQGADAVMAVSNGMAEIRERIQETAKQIKRLGESSQEIGDIVNLVSDIAEQTNILAMNAAIQAASAGEAGRGFSVVATEVQKLAERSADATRSIGALVQANQSGAADAVAAMESMTQAVINESQRTEQSAEALQQIVSASDKLNQHTAKLSGSVSGFKT